MITPKQKKLNDFIMKETGLELDQNNRVVDQDTGMYLVINNKYVKYNNTAIYRLNSDEIEFDPLNNTLLAHNICVNYLIKLNNEGVLNVTTFGISNKTRDTLGVALCISGSNRISSDQYNLDSLKYIDLIGKINNIDTNSKDTIKLKSYDRKIRR